MDEKVIVVTIPELNHIATQLSLTHIDDAITVEDIKAHLPDDKQEMAEAVFNQMIANNLIDTTTHNLSTMETFSTQVIYVSDKELSAEERAKRIEELSEEAHQGKLESLKTNEALIVDGFKISFDEKTGITIQPISQEATLNPKGLIEFLNQTQGEQMHINTLDLSPQTATPIAGELGLESKPIALSFIEYSDGTTSQQLQDLIKNADHLITNGHEVMLKPKQISEGEMDMRVNQEGTVQNGDLMLKDDVVYSFTQDGESPVVCKAIIQKENAVPEKEVFGIAVEQPPKEQNMGDEVLGEDVVEQGRSDNAETEAPEQNHGTEEPPKGAETPEVETPATPKPKRTFIDWILRREPKPPKVTVYTEEKMYNPSAEFGNGTSTTYTAQEGSERAQRVARTAAENEALKTAAEIKINTLYDEKKKLKQMDKRNVIFPLRWLRNIVYAIFKPLVANLPFFKYNRDMDKLDAEIKEIKNYYFHVKGNNSRYAKHQNVEFSDIENKPKTPEHTTERGEPAPEVRTDGPAGPNVDSPEHNGPEVKPPEQPQQTPKAKPLGKLQNEILSQIMPVGITAKIGTVFDQQSNQNKKNMVTLTTQKDGAPVSVVLPMKYAEFSKGKDPFTPDELKGLWNVILVAKQMALNEHGIDGMSQENWEKPNKDGKSPSMEVDDLLHGKSDKAKIFVGDIKADITVKGQIATISVLGTKAEIPKNLLETKPLETINQIVRQTAVNHYIALACYRLPEELNQSAFLQKETGDKISFGQMQMDITNTGRPKFEIPINMITQTGDGQSQTVAEISVNTLTGEFDVDIFDEENLSEQDKAQIYSAVKVAKCAYADIMLSHADVNDIQSTLYTQAIINTMEQDMKELEMDEEFTESFYGITTVMSREEGMVRITASDSRGNVQEFQCYGDKIDESVILEMQKMGATSMIADQKEFIAKNVQIQEQVFATSDIGFGVKDTHAPVHTGKHHDADVGAEIGAEISASMDRF